MASSSFGYIFKKPRGGSSEVGFSTTSNTAATRNIASKKRRKEWGGLVQSPLTSLMSHDSPQHFGEIVVQNYKSHVEVYRIAIHHLTPVPHALYILLNLIFWEFLLVSSSLVNCDLKTSCFMLSPICHMSFALNAVNHPHFNGWIFLACFVNCVGWFLNDFLYRVLFMSAESRKLSLCSQYLPCNGWKLKLIIELLLIKLIFNKLKGIMLFERLNKFTQMSYVIMPIKLKSIGDENMFHMLW